MREGNEQDAESACKSLRWDGRSGYANVGKRCWVGASGAHQSVVHKWCRPRIPHPSSRCVYIKCIIFCSYTYIIYDYFNLRMRRKSVVGCRSSHHRELPSVRPPVMTGAGSSSQMPSTKFWPKFCVCPRVFSSWPMSKFRPPMSRVPPPAESIEIVQYSFGTTLVTSLACKVVQTYFSRFRLAVSYAKHSAT